MNPFTSSDAGPNTSTMLPAASAGAAAAQSSTSGTAQSFIMVSQCSEGPMPLRRTSKSSDATGNTIAGLVDSLSIRHTFLSKLSGLDCSYNLSPLYGPDPKSSGKNIPIEVDLEACFRTCATSQGCDIYQLHYASSDKGTTGTGTCYVGRVQGDSLCISIDEKDAAAAWDGGSVVKIKTVPEKNSPWLSKEAAHGIPVTVPVQFSTAAGNPWPIHSWDSIGDMVFARASNTSGEFSNDARQFLSRIPVLLLDLGHNNAGTNGPGMSTETAMLEIEKIKKIATPAVSVKPSWYRHVNAGCGGAATSGRQGHEHTVDTLMVQQKACMKNALCNAVQCEAGYSNKCIMMTASYNVPSRAYDCYNPVLNDHATLFSMVYHSAFQVWGGGHLAAESNPGGVPSTPGTTATTSASTEAQHSVKNTGPGEATIHAATTNANGQIASKSPSLLVKTAARKFPLQIKQSRRYASDATDAARYGPGGPGHPSSLLHPELLKVACNSYCKEHHFDKISFAADSSALNAVMNERNMPNCPKDLKGQPCNNTDDGYILETADGIPLQEKAYGNNVWDFANSGVQELWTNARIHEQQLDSSLDGMFVDDMWQSPEFGDGLIQWQSNDQYEKWMDGRLQMIRNLTRRATEEGTVVVVNYVDLHDNMRLNFKKTFDELTYYSGAQVLYYEPTAVNAGTQGTRIFDYAREKTLGTMFLYDCGDPNGQDCTTALAEFLCGANERSYFSGPILGTGGKLDELQKIWWDAFDKPLGMPLEDCKPIPNITDSSGGPVYQRQFASGTTVTFEPNTYTGKIVWRTSGYMPDTTTTTAPSTQTTTTTTNLPTTNPTPTPRPWSPVVTNTELAASVFSALVILLVLVLVAGSRAARKKRRKVPDEAAQSSSPDNGATITISEGNAKKLKVAANHGAVASGIDGSGGGSLQAAALHDAASVKPTNGMMPNEHDARKSVAGVSTAAHPPAPLTGASATMDVGTASNALEFDSLHESLPSMHKSMALPSSQEAEAMLNPNTFSLRADELAKGFDDAYGAYSNGMDGKSTSAAAFGGISTDAVADLEGKHAAELSKMASRHHSELERAISGAAGGSTRTALTHPGSAAQPSPWLVNVADSNGDEGGEQWGAFGAKEPKTEPPSPPELEMSDEEKRAEARSKMFDDAGVFQEWILLLGTKERNRWTAKAKLTSEEQVVLLAATRRLKQALSKKKRKELKKQQEDASMAANVNATVAQLADRRPGGPVSALPVQKQPVLPQQDAPVQGAAVTTATVPSESKEVLGIKGHGGAAGSNA